MDNISVIIPVFNRASEVRRAIDSVLMQNDPSFECIVVNDGSTDTTAESVSGYTEVTLITTENLGVSSARNTGIRHSRGDWIAFLDSDDQWLPGKLFRDREFIKHHKTISLFQSNEIWVRRGVRVNQMNKHRKKSGDIFEESCRMCMISPSSAVIRKQLFNTYGNFDENLPVCEDFDLWLRFTIFEQAGLLDESSIIKFGGHNDQLSRRYWGMDRFRLYSLLKLYYDFPKNADRKKLNILTDAVMEKICILRKGAEKRKNGRLISLLSQIEISVISHTMCKDYVYLLQS